MNYNVFTIGKLLESFKNYTTKFLNEKFHFAKKKNDLITSSSNFVFLFSFVMRVIKKRERTRDNCPVFTGRNEQR